MTFEVETNNKHFYNIAETFSGSDGGMKFMKLRNYLVEQEKLAIGGNVLSQKIVEVMARFSQLIRYAEIDKRDKPPNVYNG